MEKRIINYIHEPTPLQCGQAVLAMLCGNTPEEVAKELNNERETTLREMIRYLEKEGIILERERKTVQKKEELPKVCVLSLETPKCWHWSLYCDGVFYDPEYGVLDDFPPSYRRYYFEVKTNFD